MPPPEIPYGFAGTRVVKTAPCPKCRSFRTEGTVHNGTPVLRGCLDCTWTWDAYDGVPGQYASAKREEQ